MKRTVWILALILCLLLSGCGTFMQGEYVWQETHRYPSQPGNILDAQASDHESLYAVVSAAVHYGAEQLTIYVKDYDREALQTDMERIAAELKQTDPIAAYAVENLKCSLGTSGSSPAVAIEITYLHDRRELAKIRKAADREEAETVIGQTLRNCESGVVLLIDSYSAADFEQLVESYAMQWPEYVMETPQVSVNIYPDSGRSRVVELKFSYQTNRESLKKMQSEVEPVFSSAELYVQGDGSDHEKYMQLYAFLMERFEYKLETSITPSYSLLRHGVGDPRAFANVYAAMCRRAGLTCMVVSGAREGESHYWNIILEDGVYYHLDLLHLTTVDTFKGYADEEMNGYVWDYSSYPACGPQEEQKPGQGEEDFGPNK